jgi:hypothetical protein
MNFTEKVGKRKYLSSVKYVSVSGSTRTGARARRRPSPSPAPSGRMIWERRRLRR